MLLPAGEAHRFPQAIHEQAKDYRRHRYRQYQNGALLVPIRSLSGNLQSLQRIFPGGEKRFLTGGKIHGGHFVLQGKPEKPLIICEGYATGASIHLASACTVYVAFSTNNLSAVAGAVRGQFPDKTILVCADSDETGRGKGQEDAQAAQARLVITAFHAGTVMRVDRKGAGDIYFWTTPIFTKEAVCLINWIPFVMHSGSYCITA